MLRAGVLTAIASRQDGGAVPATLQLISEIVGERSLPRPADGDAANADHGKRQPLLTSLVAPGFEITAPGPQPGGRTENEPGEQAMRSFRIGSPIERPQLLRNALRRTLLVLNEQLRPMRHVSRLAGVKEQAGHGSLEFFNCANLNHRAGIQQIACDGCEIFHVRAGDDGRAGGGRLDDIVPTARGERAADKNDVGPGKNARQFADGVDSRTPGS